MSSTLTTSTAALLAAADWRTLAVWRRNAQVYLRKWKTAFIPPAMEPLVFFFAFGLGLAGFVGTMSYGGTAITYPTYVAPGLIAFTAFGTPFYEALYSSYVRMFYQKTWDGMLATQVELHHILWGEALWAATRGLMNATLVAVVLAGVTAFGLINLHLEFLPVILVLALFAGCAFAAFALVFTAIVPAIDHMNYPVFLVGMPLSFSSATYFPVEPHHPALRALLACNPLYHLAETSRSALVLGRIDLAHLRDLLISSTGLLIIAMLLAQWLMHRRLLGGR